MTMTTTGCPSASATRVAGRADSAGPFHGLRGPLTGVTPVTYETAWRCEFDATDTYAAPMSTRNSAGVSAASRRQRSVRVTVAVGLLATATLAVVCSLVLGSLAAASAAAVLALLAGCAATRIVANELAQSRRDAARERVTLAHDYARLSAQRVAEQAGFARTMTDRVRERDAEIGRLHGTIRLADRRVAKVQARLRTEEKLTAELREQVDQLGRELEEQRDDSLAFWDGGQASTVVDLLAWEERTTAERTDVRRQA